MDRWMTGRERDRSLDTGDCNCKPKKKKLQSLCLSLINEIIIIMLQLAGGKIDCILNPSMQRRKEGRYQVGK